MDSRRDRYLAVRSVTYLGPSRGGRILEEIPERLAQAAQRRLAEVLLLLPLGRLPALEKEARARAVMSSCKVQNWISRGSDHVSGHYVQRQTFTFPAMNPLVLEKSSRLCPLPGHFQLNAF